MNSEFTPIQNLEPDLDPNKSCVLINPLPVDFEYLFAGKKCVIKANSSQVLPTPKAFHAAKHLANKIANENLYTDLQATFKKDDDESYWRKKMDLRVKPETINELINLLVNESGEIEDISSKVASMKSKAKTNKHVGKNIKNPVKTEVEEENNEPEEEDLDELESENENELDELPDDELEETEKASSKTPGRKPKNK